MAADRTPAWAPLWPEAERRVRRALLRRGVPSESVADVLQDSAVRLVRSPAEIDTVDDLAAWTYTVASRLLVDQGRRRRVPVVPLGEDSVDHGDPAAIIEARADWHAVVTAMQRLNDGDRAALLSVFEEAPTERADAVRWAVRRHRARHRLATMVGRVGGIAVGAWVAARRQFGWRWVTVPAVAAPMIIAVSWGPAAPPTSAGPLDVAFEVPRPLEVSAVIAPQRDGSRSPSASVGPKLPDGPPPAAAPPAHADQPEQAKPRVTTSSGGRLRTFLDDRETSVVPAPVMEIYRSRPVL